MYKADEKMGENLRKAREALQIPTMRMAEMYNIPYRTYCSYERGERSIPHKLLAQIVQEFNLNLNFLYYGEGDILAEDGFATTTYELPVRGAIEASLGYGVTVYNEDITSTFSISKKFANDLGINPKTAEVIFARGDSMEPTILNGDSVIVDLSKRELHDGIIYCIKLEDGLFIKRLQKVSKTTVGIVSDNSKYTMRIVDLVNNIDGFDIVGEVRWIGRVPR